MLSKGHRAIRLQPHPSSTGLHRCAPQLEHAGEAAARLHPTLQPRSSNTVHDLRDDHRAYHRAEDAADLRETKGEATGLPENWSYQGMAATLRQEIRVQRAMESDRSHVAHQLPPLFPS